MRTRQKLEQEVAALGDLSRAKLVEAWIKAHGSPPPKGVKQHLLELSAAWHLQAKRLGGLSATTRKVLLRAHQVAGAQKRSVLDADADAFVPHKPARSALVSGSRLLREWNGRKHVVDVVENGFVFDGKTYRSLSAIARRITGAHWSGPRFFGL